MGDWHDYGDAPIRVQNVQVSTATQQDIIAALRSDLGARDALIAAVLELHHSEPSALIGSPDFCAQCILTWPCPTAALLHQTTDNKESR